MSLPQHVECDHCGYVNDHEVKRLREVGASGAWVCPACSVCNTTYHVEAGFITQLGYNRELEIRFL